ncbi:MAG: hypothetical protein KBB52_04950 [Candidatus Omnitrophica bacterium]|nr:hypothetical protein [Candidatus Omnitrophota bacterium]
MTEDLKGLIEKIQEEGISAAEAKAHAIETEAKKRASDIIEDARKKSEDMIHSAKKEVERSRESTEATLKQAGRDLILSLRQEINSILGKLVEYHVHKALNPEGISHIVASLLKNQNRPEKDGIVITAKREDLEKLEKALLEELGHKAREGITLKPSDAIRGGFIISYDSGRSYFDFSDKAIVDYISEFLRPRIASILKG